MTSYFLLVIRPSTPTHIALNCRCFPLFQGSGIYTLSLITLVDCKFFANLKRSKASDICGSALIISTCKADTVCCGSGTVLNIYGCSTSHLNGNSSKTCSTCPEGSYCATTGLSAVMGACAVGHYSISGSSNCTNCTVGTYAPIYGSSFCFNCAVGTYARINGSSFCFNCTVGTYAPINGSSFCSNCTVGQYSALNGSSICSECTVGTFSSSNGSSFCSECTIGTISAINGSASCTNCTIGKYSAFNGSSVCEFCLAGLFSARNGSSYCLNCTAGTFAPINGSAYCSNCTTGQYSTKSGSAVCSMCPAGTSSPHFAATSFSTCTPCPAGAFSSTNATSCTICAAGYYSNSNASACAGTLHDFDLRACTVGSIVADSYWPSMALVVTPHNFPTCSATGMTFNGLNQYAQVTSWSWGGTVSIEVYASVRDFYHASRIFDFGGGEGCNNVSLSYLNTAQSSFPYYLYPENIEAQYTTSSPFWVLQAYVHAVLTIDAKVITLYRNGSQFASVVNGATPATLTRSAQYLARSSKSQDFFANITLAYVRIYNDLALDAAAVAALNLKRLHCKAGLYGSRGSCYSCPAGMYQPTSKAVTACSNCAAGYFSNMSSSACTNSAAGFYSSGTSIAAVSYNEGGHSSFSVSYDSVSANFSSTWVGNGFNILTFSTMTGDLLAVKNFDTYQTIKSSSSMLAYLHSIKDGTLAVFFIQGEAETHLRTDVKLYMSDKFGASYISSIEPGDSYVLIAMKSANRAFGEAWSSTGFVKVNGFLGASAASSCSAGHFAASARATTCLACAAGFYQASSASSSCVTCAAGSYQADDASISCVSCTMGSYSAVNASISCVSCAMGTFGPVSGASSCMNCNGGKYSAIVGATLLSTCNSCRAGTFSIAAAAACTACAAGNYHTSAGASACAACVGGKYSSISGSTSLSVCTTCPAGSSAGAGAPRCAPCAAGSFQPRYF